MRRDWGYFFFAAVGLFIVSGWFQSSQLAHLINTHGIKTSYFDVFRYQMISNFYGLLFVGQVVSAGVSWYLLSKDHAKKLEVVNCLVYVRLINVLVALILALLALLIDPSARNWFSPRYTAVGIAVLTALFLPLVSPVIYRVIRKKISWKLLKVAEESSRIGLSHVALHVVWSVLNACMGAAVMYFSFQLASIPMNPAACFWMRGLLVIIQFVPMTFAGLGVREVSLVALLDHYYQVPAENALILSFSLFFYAVFVYGGIGAYFAFNFRRLRKKER